MRDKLVKHRTKLREIRQPLEEAFKLLIDREKESEALIKEISSLKRMEINTSKSYADMVKIMMKQEGINLLQIIFGDQSLQSQTIRSMLESRGIQHLLQTISIILEDRNIQVCSMGTAIPVIILVTWQLTVRHQ